MLDFPCLSNHHIPNMDQRGNERAKSKTGTRDSPRRTTDNSFRHKFHNPVVHCKIPGIMFLEIWLFTIWLIFTHARHLQSRSPIKGLLPSLYYTVLHTYESTSNVWALCRFQRTLVETANFSFWSREHSVWTTNVNINNIFRRSVLKICQWRCYKEQFESVRLHLELYQTTDLWYK